MNWEKLKACYETTSADEQIGSLSMNLIRIQSLLENGVEEPVAQHLIRESQHFIEWTVRELNLETDIALVQELLSLQRLLSRWKLDWSARWRAPDKRKEMAKSAQHWHEHLQGYVSAIAS